MMSFGFSLLRLQALRRHCMRVLHLPGTCTRQDLAKVVGAAAAFSSEIDPKDKVYSWSAGYWFLVIDDDCGYSSYPLRCRHPWKSLVFGQFRHQSLHLYLINTYEDLKNRPSSFVILSMAADCKSQLNSFTLVSRCQYTIFVIAGRNWRAVCQTCLPLDCRSAISLFRIVPLCHCRFVAARHEKTDTIQSPLVFFRRIKVWQWQLMQSRYTIANKFCSCDCATRPILDAQSPFCIVSTVYFGTDSWRGSKVGF